MAARNYPGVVSVNRRRGTAHYIKFRDSDGRQVKELVGYSTDGMTAARAAKVREERLVDVRRDGWRQPAGVTFADWAERFLSEHMPTRNLKLSTETQYRGELRNHLIPSLGRCRLTELEQRPELIERMIAAKLAAGLSPKSVHNIVVTLSLVLKLAQRRRLIRTNPCDLVDRPRLEGHEVGVLDGGAIARLLGAFQELEAAPPEDTEAAWFALCRRLVTVGLATGMRRGELLGLRWRDVNLLDGFIRVERAYVRGEMTTPKSRRSRRTLEAGPVAIAALEEQWQATMFRDDDDLVFGHPTLGTPVDPSKLTRTYAKPALKRGGLPEGFRPWHDLRHTALTHAAALHATAVVQQQAGHANSSTTDRYVQLARVRFPGAAAETELRMFGKVENEAAAA